MRAEWIPGDVMGALLAAMMPANALALEASMATGLRIGDVLAITRQQCARGRFTVSEEKTGKHRRGDFLFSSIGWTRRGTGRGRRCIKTCAAWRPCIA